jgi:hypothetical protein
MPAFLVFFCAALGAALCYAQDVAEAAKQERARKEAKQKKNKHVYTEEDLKKAFEGAREFVPYGNNPTGGNHKFKTVEDYKTSKLK